VWGFTRALEEGTVPLDTCASYTGKGVLVASRTDTPPEAPPWGGPPPQLWGSFQWLPAQVELAADGSANITSYINNLHPTEHKALYGTLERIVAATVPLWEDALNGFRDRRRFDLRNTGSEDFIFPPGLKYQIPGRQGAKSLYNPVTGKCEDAEGERGAEADNDENDDDDDDDFDVEEEDWRWDEDFFDWERSNRVLVYREPRDYVPHTELVKREESTGNATFKTISLRDSFPDGLQVIFKLANILLTPEHPSYEGGSWHVEGTLNEMICASAIYYYDQDNITDSHLAFRQHMSAEEIMMIPEQGEYESLERYLGVEQNGPAMQHLGQVLTKEGRLLVFPNCLQHQVQPFELQDKSRGGHRKILAMFLVDPHRPILSSAHVPPQRRDWWAAEVHRQGGLSALPNELADLVMNEVDGFPVSWEQACGLRERLMDERRGINEGLTDLSRLVSDVGCEYETGDNADLIGFGIGNIQLLRALVADADGAKAGLAGGAIFSSPANGVSWVRKGVIGTAVIFL
jgi:hypothetical protein